MMRRPTLLEAVVFCWNVALLAALLVPARQPRERRPPYEVVLQAVGLLSGLLALAGTVWLVGLLGGRWLRSRVRGSAPMPPRGPGPGP
jgi:hypothetical protein